MYRTLTSRPTSNETNSYFAYEVPTCLLIRDGTLRASVQAGTFRSRRPLLLAPIIILNIILTTYCDGGRGTSISNSSRNNKPLRV